MLSATLQGLLNELEKIAAHVGVITPGQSVAGPGRTIQDMSAAERDRVMEEFSAKAMKNARAKDGVKTKASPKPAPPVATPAESASTSVKAVRKRPPAPISAHTPPPAVATHVPGAPHVSPGVMSQSRGFLSRRPGLAMGAVGAAGLIGGAGLMAMAHRRRQEA